jgi:hypothetical protein
MTLLDEDPRSRENTGRFACPGGEGFCTAKTGGCILFPLGGLDFRDGTRGSEGWIGEWEQKPRFGLEGVTALFGQRRSPLHPGRASEVFTSNFEIINERPVETCIRK